MHVPRVPLWSCHPARLQAAGAALLGSANGLSELVTVQGNVVSGIAAVTGTREVRGGRGQRQSVWKLTSQHNMPMTQRQSASTVR